MTTSDRAVLLIHCPDQTGIIASVTNFIKANKGNITYLEQHVDAQENIFFMRVEWELLEFIVPIEKVDEVFSTEIAKKFRMKWKLYLSTDRPRMAIFVSRLPHCLYDILSRYISKEWKVDIPLIISNHKEIDVIANRFGIKFHFIPITQENKLSQEIETIKLLEENQIDFVVLARYMQIINKHFTDKYPERIINIHHSFLPAFPGAKPYHSAHKRGVKIIGATSHFVTDELDEGPIIEQDVVRVSHLDSIQDMIRKGRDLEKIVLARAIYKYLDRKILVYKNKSIIFN
jgi:formyltetrahydrofolate deformylase